MYLNIVCMFYIYIYIKCIQFEIAIFLILSVKILKNINWFEAGSWQFQKCVKFKLRLKMLLKSGAEEKSQKL